MELYVKEELQLWIAQKLEALDNMERRRGEGLDSTESCVLRKSDAGRVVHYATKSAAEEVVRALMTETAAQLIHSFMNDLPTRNLAILQSFCSRSFSHILPDHWDILRNAQSRLDGPDIDAQMALTDEMEAKEAKWREIPMPVFHPALLRDALDNLVKANNSTKTETKLVCERVVVGYGRSFGGGEAFPIYDDKIVSKQLQVKCTDYSVCRTAVMAFVTDIFLNSVEQAGQNLR